MIALAALAVLWIAGVILYVLIMNIAFILGIPLDVANDRLEPDELEEEYQYIRTGWVLKIMKPLLILIILFTIINLTQ